MTQKTYTPTRPYGGIDASERRQTRRDTFVEAGLESFGTIGYTRSTIKGICDIAGLTQRYFYESFKDKEDLLIAVYRKLILDIESEAGTIIAQPGLSPEDMAIKGLTMFFRRFKDDPRRARVQLFEVLGVSPLVDNEYRSAMITLADWIRLFMLIAFPGLGEKWKVIGLIHTGAAGAIIQISNQWVLDGLKTPIDEMAEQAVDAFRAVGLYYSGQGDI
jgi:AcrR family transcriptional regulator